MKSSYYSLFCSFLIWSLTLATTGTGKDDKACANTSIAKRLTERDTGNPSESTIYVTTSVTHISTSTITVPHPGTSSSATSAPNVVGISTIFTTTSVTQNCTSTKFIVASGTASSSKSIVSKPFGVGATTAASSNSHSSNPVGGSLLSSLFSTRPILKTTITIPCQNKTSPASSPASGPSHAPVLSTSASKTYEVTKSSSLAGTSTALVTTIRSTAHVTSTMTSSSQANRPTTSAFPVHPSSVVGSGSNTSSQLSSSVHGGGLSRTSSSTPIFLSSKPISYATVTIMKTEQGSANGSQALSNSQQGGTLTGSSANESISSIGKAPPGTGSSQLGTGHASSQLTVSTNSMPISSTVQTGDGLTTFGSIKINTLYSTKTVSTSGSVFIYYVLQTYTFTHSPPSTTHASGPPLSLTTATLKIGTSFKTLTLTLAGSILANTRSTGPSHQSATATVSSPTTVDNSVTQTSYTRTITAGPSTTGPSTESDLSSSQSTRAAISTESSATSTVSTLSSSGARASSSSEMGALLAIGIAILLV